MNIETLTQEIQQTELRVLEFEYIKNKKEIEELNFDNIYDLCEGYPYMINRYPEIREEFIKQHFIDFNYNKYYDICEIKVNKQRLINEQELLKLIKDKLIKNFNIDKYHSDYYMTFEVEDAEYEIYYYNYS